MIYTGSSLTLLQRGKICFVYIDVVFYSKSEEEHLAQLSEVFQCLNHAGLNLNLQKCNLMQKSLKFLGHVISADGLKTDPAKVEAVANFAKSPYKKCKVS